MAIVANAFPLLMVSSVSAIRGGKVFGAFLRIPVATVALFRFFPLVSYTLISMFDVLFVFVLSTRERVSLSCKNSFFIFLLVSLTHELPVLTTATSLKYTFYMLRAS